MDFEDSLRQRLRREGNAFHAAPPPFDALRRSTVSIAPPPPHRRTRLAAASAMGGACIAVAVVAISAVADDPATPPPNDDTSAFASAPTTNAAAGSTTTLPAGEVIEPSPLLIDDPSCSGVKAYEIATSPAGPDDVSGTWYIPAADGHSGGWGFLYAPGGRDVPSSLSGPDVTGVGQVLGDGTGVYDWTSGDTTVARLSTKRMDALDLERLARAISTGESEEAGYLALPTPDVRPSVLGSSCASSGGLIGVEVVVGDLAAQVDQLGNADPASIEFRDGYAIATFGHSIDEVPPLRAAGTSEWQDLLAATEAAGPP